MFAFNNQQLRGVKIDGEPWFVAADVCRALHLNMRPSGRPNVTVSLAGLDADEKGVEFIDTLGGPQKMAIVSRPGLFKLIARSHKPVAKEFDRWVRHEVLPQIMDNGGYVMKDAKCEVRFAFKGGYSAFLETAAAYRATTCRRRKGPPMGFLTRH